MTQSPDALAQYITWLRDAWLFIGGLGVGLIVASVWRGSRLAEKVVDTKGPPRFEDDLAAIGRAHRIVRDTMKRHEPKPKVVSLSDWRPKSK